MKYFSSREVNSYHYLWVSCWDQQIQSDLLYVKACTVSQLKTFLAFLVDNAMTARGNARRVNKKKKKIPRK